MNNRRAATGPNGTANTCTVGRRHRQAFGLHGEQRPLDPERPPHTGQPGCADEFGQTVVSATATDGRLRAELVVHELVQGAGVIVEAAHEPRLVGECDPGVRQHRPNGVMVGSVSGGQEIGDDRRLLQRRLDLGPLVVQNPQRVELDSPTGLFVEVEPAKVGLQGSPERRTGLVRAKRIDQQAHAGQAKPPVGVHRQHDGLGVGGRVVRSDDFGADLREMAKAALLRPFVPEVRAGVPHLDRQPRRCSPFSTTARSTGAVPSGRRVNSSPPRVVKEYISLVTTSVDSPTPRTNSAVSSKIGVSRYPYPAPRTGADIASRTARTASLRGDTRSNAPLGTRKSWLIPLLP